MTIILPTTVLSMMGFALISLRDRGNGFFPQQTVALVRNGRLKMAVIAADLIQIVNLDPRHTVSVCKDVAMIKKTDT